MIDMDMRLLTSGLPSFSPGFHESMGERSLHGANTPAVRK